LEGKTQTYTAGRRKVVFSDDCGISCAWSTRTGEIIDAEGNRYHAVLTFCDMDSGEFYGAFVFTSDGVKPQEKMPKTFFPFQYKPYTAIPGDIHAGSNGWSR
jgi:hypothetical protein